VRPTGCLVLGKDQATRHDTASPGEARGGTRLHRTQRNSW